MLIGTTTRMFEANRSSFCNCSLPFTLVRFCSIHYLLLVGATSIVNLPINLIHSEIPENVWA